MPRTAAVLAALLAVAHAADDGATASSSSAPLRQKKQYVRWRDDIDDAVFSELDDDFFAPGAEAWRHAADDGGAAVGRRATREQMAGLPLCNVSCAAIFEQSAFAFAPDRAARRGTAYDHTCALLKSEYHTAPACLASAGLPRAEHFEWTLRDALGPRPTCRLHDWSPAEAARAWLGHHHRAAQERAEEEGTKEGAEESAAASATAAARRDVTVLLLGSSFFRQVFEAIACRWSAELDLGPMHVRYKI